MFNYKTRGTCSTAIRFDLRDGRIYSLSFENGCDGNLKAIGILAEGMEAVALIERLRGLRCGSRATSCADQLARAVTEAIGKNQGKGKTGHSGL
jgi:uncharacterized protein (TIGR03905 family)